MTVAKLMIVTRGLRERGGVGIGEGVRSCLDGEGGMEVGKGEWR